MLSVDNDRDTDTFRLLDAARVAKKVIRACVENPMPNPRWGVLRWGGVDGLGDQAENFYVSVGRPVGARGLGVGNGTVLVEES